MKFFLPLAFFLLLACASPGTGKKADDGYNTCSPIIAALESFRKARGEYPRKLKDLKPKFLKEIPEEFDEFPIEYNRQSNDSFSLDFSYKDNGVFNCDYTPVRKWKCYGFY